MAFSTAAGDVMYDGRKPDIVCALGRRRSLLAKEGRSFGRGRELYTEGFVMVVLLVYSELSGVFASCNKSDITVTHFASTAAKSHHDIMAIVIAPKLRLLQTKAHPRGPAILLKRILRRSVELHKAIGIIIRSCDRDHGVHSRTPAVSGRF